MDRSLSDTVASDTQQYQNIVDLTKLEEITLENVLDCLINRFISGHFYTFVGNVLISFNPSSHPSRIQFRSPKQVDLAGYVPTGTESIKPPHIYSVGQKCLEGLHINGNQVVVVSGDSGAGKTTVTQQLLCYFIEKNHEKSTLKVSSPSRNNLERKIYCSTLILEAMGNACTQNNPNSSRFGRLVQLNYKTISGVETIIRAQIDTCLLEKYRVSKFGRERNFHIFYYVLVAIQTDRFDMGFLGSSMKDPLILIPPYFQETLRKTDFDDFESFWQSVVTLKMNSEVQYVFQIIFGVMMLLNIHFVPAANSNRSGQKYPTSSEESDGDEKENRPRNENILLESDSTYIKKATTTSSSYSFFGQNGKGFAISNPDSLEPLEEIFEVDLYALMDTLLSRNITAGRRKSTVRKTCETYAECQQRLFSLVSIIYDSLFTYILHRLNSLLEISDQDQTTSLVDPGCKENNTKTLALLDLYGFENLGTNHLEQLCINYANERLQEVHMSHLKSFMSQLSYKSTSSCEIDRVQQELSSRLNTLHSTVFTILNEACMLNRSQADEQVYNCLRSSIKENRFIRAKKLQDQNCPFVIKHYAGEVEYHLRGMTDKNRDYIPPEFLDLLQSSSSLTIKSMFAPPTANTESKLEDNKKSINNKAKREKTILQRFKSSVEKLIDQLEDAVKKILTERISFCTERVKSYLKENCDSMSPDRKGPAHSIDDRGIYWDGTQFQCRTIVESDRFLSSVFAGPYFKPVAKPTEGRVGDDMDDDDDEVLISEPQVAVGGGEDPNEDPDKFKRWMIGVCQVVTFWINLKNALVQLRAGYGCGNVHIAYCQMTLAESKVEGSDLDVCEDAVEHQLVRCIRPNNDLIQGRVDRDLIKKQLYAIGIIDLIRISANGYPIRIPTVKFFKKFRTIILRCFSSHGFEQEKFRASFNFKKSQLRFGVTQVFMTEETWKFLLQLEQKIWERVVLKCQRTWRDLQRRKLEREAEEQATRLIEEMLRVKSSSVESKVEDTDLDFFEDAVEYQFLATSTPAPDKTRDHHRSLTDLRTGFMNDFTSDQVISDTFHRQQENFYATPNPRDESTLRLRRRAKLHVANSSCRSKSSDSRTSCYPGPQGDAPHCHQFNNTHLVFVDPHDPALSCNNSQEESKKPEENKKLECTPVPDDKDSPSGVFDSPFWKAIHSCAKLFVSEDRRIVSRSHIYKGPIRFYTKRTALPNNHVIPLRLKGLGLAELLES